MRQPLSKVKEMFNIGFIRVWGNRMTKFENKCALDDISIGPPHYKRYGAATLQRRLLYSKV